MILRTLMFALHFVAAPLSWGLARRWPGQILLLAILLVLAGGSVFLIRKSERNTARHVQVAENRQLLDRAIEYDNGPAAEALFARLAELTRNEPAIAVRWEAFKRGTADEQDPALARLLMIEHLRKDRLAEATREAAKAIALEPHHMMARGLLARQALREGKADRARDHLAAIPSPFANPDRATPGALQVVIGVKRDLGDDDIDLLSFIIVRVLPLMKSSQLGQLPSDAKLELVRCYHLACRALDRHPELSEYWVPGVRILEQYGSEGNSDLTIALIREAHLAVAYQLRAKNAMPDANIGELVQEFEAQVQKSWVAAKARDERAALPYAGLALANQRRGDMNQAQEWLDRGLKVSSNPRSLYLEMGRLLRESDPLTAAIFLEQAYERFPDDLAVQQMLAELAFAAGRPDRARQVCRDARKSRPDLTWACRLEAAASLVLGQPTQALEALAPLEPTLTRNSTTFELYVQAACLVGAEASIERLISAGPADAAEADGYAGAAKGYLQSGRLDLALRCASRVIAKFPDHVPARTAYAESLRLVAEAGDSSEWKPDDVRKALDEYEWLRQCEPGARWLAQRIAWLQLKGLNAPQQAAKSVAPLRTDTRLTPEMAETLGAVLVANDQTEAALRTLDKAVNASPGRAGSWIERAAAQLKLGRRAAARSDLARAAALPRSPRQLAEWQRLDRELRGER